ncbi:hypothetical protein DBR42_15375 [Pelomonas sp. HMWF004]|nr:hypothetical protein DBR42_15375 [Pelomonas sp. HMWF004]
MERLAIFNTGVSEDQADVLAAMPLADDLRQDLNFMKGKPWLRHDKHDHMDFAVACKTLN